MRCNRGRRVEDIQIVLRCRHPDSAEVQVLIRSIGEETYTGQAITDEPTWIGTSIVIQRSC